MKRTLSAMLTAAAVAGCQSPVGGLASRGHSDTGFSHHLPTPGKMESQAAKQQVWYGETPAKSADSKQSDIQQVAYNHGHGAMQNRTFNQRIARAVPSHGGGLPGMPGMMAGGGMPGMGPMGPMGGPMGPGMGGPMGPGGPGCGPGGPGGMAGMGPMGPGGPGMMGLGPNFAVGRSQVRFVRPSGMRIGWQSPAAGDPSGFTPPQLEAPARYNFAQARIYRLKLTDIPTRAGLELYPTLEIYPGNTKVDAYLAHNAIPIEFADEDFDQVLAGNYVTKVIYLPDPRFQELAIAGVETLVSTRLDPGIDPVQEAHRRGAILAVVRMGSVDLEMPHSPELFPQPPVPGGIISMTDASKPGSSPAGDPSQPGQLPVMPAPTVTMPVNAPTK